MAYGYYPQFYPPVYQAQQNPQMNQQNQQMQNTGFISVPSEDIVSNYPVAPGNCVTFKIEGKPIVMEKSMGFSQLEPPRIERYRLVKEEMAHTEPKEEKASKTTTDYIKTEIGAIWSELNRLKKELYGEDKEGDKNDDE